MAISTPPHPSPGLSTYTCAAIAQLVALSRKTWCCMPALPANTTAGLVALKRPITFTVACLAALVAVVASWFLNLTGLEPPSCPADGPRTRRRPASPVLPESPREYESSTQAQAALRSLTSFVSETLRPKSALDHPPVSKHRTLRAAPRFAYHELDGVLESAEEEEDSQSRSRRNRTTSPASRTSTETSAVPALTPDAVSDADSDDLSDHEALAHSTKRSGAGPAAAKGGKPKGLQIFTSGFKWKRTASHESKTSSSPTTSVGVSSFDQGGGASSTTRPGPVPHTIRQRANTIMHPPCRTLPSTLNRPSQRRHVSDSDSSSSASWTPPSSSSTSSSTDSPAAAATSSAQSATSQPATRKRAQTSLFFRSLSPLSKSPVPSPENSPPPSPRLRSAPSASSSGCPSLRLRRGVSPARKSSLDSVSSRSSVESARETSQPQQPAARGRKPAFGRRLPVPSPPLSQQVVDLGGHSGLSLGDFARR
ncbi:hypothetical protein JCM8115_005020 [Rhodotorula mucilaginosa]|uniref:Uncharacterized protein n=1 Tax=Rhodotorula mucilaginosa TaxID=5537 RepID=A0A9P7B934_RHOMI|nr:hypothetical protein C6P46_000087 [Rhodotorula mucilaginosa]TKA57318.1 hypothetical protein B0A53_00543 [Rhodotorula sp. CCFEE 5036]